MMTSRRWRLPPSSAPFTTLLLSLALCVAINADTGATTTSDLLEQALRKHHDGQVDEAARLYDQVLQSNPDHSDALHLLGLLQHEKGYGWQAVEMIRKAIENAKQV